MLFSIIVNKTVKIFPNWMFLNLKDVERYKEGNTATPHLYKLAIGVVDCRLGRVGMGHIEEVVVHLRSKIETNMLRGLTGLKYINLICLKKKRVWQWGEKKTIFRITI